MNRRPSTLQSSAPPQETWLTERLSYSAETKDVHTLRVVRYRSIHQIDEGLWDSINSEHDLFHTHRFVRSVEDAEIDGTAFWYLVWYQSERIVATAALSRLVVALDLFLGKTVQNIVSVIRRLFPNFFRVHILFCGLPVSIGKNALTIADLRHVDEVLKSLVEEMTHVACTHRIRFLCVKEFLEEEIEQMNLLDQFGFFIANSIPYVSLHLRWTSFTSYLAEMKHEYRRPVVRSLRKLGLTQPLVHHSPPSNNEKPYLVISRSADSPKKKFFELYRDVLEHTSVKLEVLNLAFFKSLFRNMDNDMEILSMIKGEDVLGIALLTIEQKTMTFLLVGLDFTQRDRYDVYFNLVYGIIARAIERGCTQLNLGQTSYWVKGRIGGKCSDEYFFLRAENQLIHRLLKWMRPLIFPKTTSRHVQVFREVT